MFEWTNIYSKANSFIRIGKVATVARFRDLQIQAFDVARVSRLWHHATNCMCATEFRRKRYSKSEHT
jgi:hypothetical protein